MQTITPHLWFDKQAREAAERYASIFENSGVERTMTLHDTPSGDTEIVAYDLAGQRFMAISAGPLFKFNPSVSFRVDCETGDEVDALWNRLIEGGAALMPLDTYPFSDRYGWLEDRYGLSWQVMHVGGAEITQKITPTLMFVGDQSGKAEQAIRFYTSVFEDSEVGDIMRYAEGEAPDEEGTVKHAAFRLAGQRFAAMDSASEHDFSFNEAISFMVYCDTQEEIDDYWKSLSAVPEAEQCGWLKDRYGVSWQIVPLAMDRMLGEGNDEQTARVTEAFLGMKKLDIAKLEEAYASASF